MGRGGDGVAPARAIMVTLSDSSPLRPGGGGSGGAQAYSGQNVACIRPWQSLHNDIFLLTHGYIILSNAPIITTKLRAQAEFHLKPSWKSQLYLEVRLENMNFGISTRKYVQKKLSNPKKNHNCDLLGEPYK